MGNLLIIIPQKTSCQTCNLSVLNTFTILLKIKELYILRGLPGSGKSTLAESLGGYHIEADMYFTGNDGEYNFDPKNLPTAHQWCQAMVAEWMNEDVDRIVVSNTSTQKWEIEPYMSMAEEYGYTVFSLIVENRRDRKSVV